MAPTETHSRLDIEQLAEHNIPWDEQDSAVDDGNAEHVDITRTPNHSGSADLAHFSHAPPSFATFDPQTYTEAAGQSHLSQIHSDAPASRRPANPPRRRSSIIDRPRELMRTGLRRLSSVSFRRQRPPNSTASILDPAAAPHMPPVSSSRTGSLPWEVQQSTMSSNVAMMHPRTNLPIVPGRQDPLDGLRMHPYLFGQRSSERNDQGIPLAPSVAEAAGNEEQPSQHTFCPPSSRASTDVTDNVSESESGEVYLVRDRTSRSALVSTSQRCFGWDGNHHHGNISRVNADFAHASGVVAYELDAASSNIQELPTDNGHQRDPPRNENSAYAHSGACADFGFLLYSGPNDSSGSFDVYSSPLYRGEFVKNSNDGQKSHSSLAGDESLPP
jgi:hypothetical protein